MVSQKWSAKTGTEGSLWFRNAAFCTGHFGCVAGDKVVHRLFRRQLRDGWQDTEGVGGQEDDVLWVAAKPFPCGVGQVGDRINTTRIFG